MTYFHDGIVREALFRPAAFVEPSLAAVLSDKSYLHVLVQVQHRAPAACLLSFEDVRTYSFDRELDVDPAETKVLEGCIHFELLTLVVEASMAHAALLDDSALGADVRIAEVLDAVAAFRHP